MVDGSTLRPTHNPHEPPDHVKQVVAMVRSLSNKYVPMPSLDEVKIDIMQGLKDFRQRVRKRAAAVHLREGTVDTPAGRTNHPSQSAGSSVGSTDIDSWHEGMQPDDTDLDRYGFGSDLYDAISAIPECDSSQCHLEAFFDK